MDMLDSQAEEHRAAVARAGATRRARARRAPPAPADQNPEIQPFPAWARPRGEDGDAAFSAGAGLALFDMVLRGGAQVGDVSGAAEPAFAGCLRQRLALRAAENGATLARLREDAGALRDAEHLATGGEISPAGRLHRLFRLHAGKPARLDAATLAGAMGRLDLREIDAGAVAQALAARLAGAADPLAAAAGASAVAMGCCAAASTIDAEILALWVADVALAQRLDWVRPVPLLAVAILHPSLRRGAGTGVKRGARTGTGEREMERARRPRPSDEDWPQAAALAYALAAAEAHALARDLARRAGKLLAVAPALRAKGAARVVDMLLADDGVTPAAAARAGLSDRAARRLFDRLVALGAARELTGRDTFRIYGL
jgi:hypothetical protein